MIQAPNEPHSRRTKIEEQRLRDLLVSVADGRLLEAPSVETMRRPTEASGGSYGLGLAMYRLSCGTFFGHGGAVNGTVSIAMVDATGGSGVVAVMNMLGEVDAGMPALAVRLLCPAEG